MSLARDPRDFGGFIGRTLVRQSWEIPVVLPNVAIRNANFLCTMESENVRQHIV